MGTTRKQNLTETSAQLLALDQIRVGVWGSRGQWGVFWEPVHFGTPLAGLGGEAAGRRSRRVAKPLGGEAAGRSRWAAVFHPEGMAAVVS